MRTVWTVPYLIEDIVDKQEIIPVCRSFAFHTNILQLAVS